MRRAFLLSMTSLRLELSKSSAFWRMAIMSHPWAQPRQGLRALSDGEFQVIVLDLSLPDDDGLEVVRQIRGEYPDLSILAISGFMVGDMSSIALAAGATATLIKPTISCEFLNTVYRLLDPSEGWKGWMRRSKSQTASYCDR